MIFRFMLYKNSLFVKLLFGFGAIIIVSFVFNALSFRFFTSSIRDQIITYNTSSLSNTVGGFENQLRLLDNVLGSIYFQSDVGLLRKDAGSHNYPLINELSGEFQTIVRNYNLFAENVFVYFDDQGVIIDKSSSHTEQEMFGRYYVSDRYPANFWKQQFDRDFHLKLFPAAAFRTTNPDNSVSEAGTLFPIVIKSKLFAGHYIAAFLDAKAIFNHLHLSDNDHFSIVDDSGEPYFRSGAAPDPRLVDSLSGADRYVQLDQNYYFIQKGPLTGLTYVSMIPNQQIAAQISRMNAILIGLIALSVFLSIVLSIMLSVRFKHPIQKIAESLRKMSVDIQHNSNIREFQQISDSVKGMIDTMRRKDSLLQKYAYVDRVKGIYINNDEVGQLLNTDRPFYFVMFQIRVTDRFHQTPIMERKKSTFLLDFINLAITGSFPEAVSLQVEADSIVTIVFTEHEQTDLLTERLLYLKHVFDRDKSYYYVTIAANPRLRYAVDFTDAYVEAVEMVRKRKLNDEVQIIAEPEKLPDVHPLTPAEEQHFLESLLAGNDRNMIHDIRRSLNRLDQKGATALQYRQFAHTIVSKLLLTLMANKIDTGNLQLERPPFETIDRFVSKEEYVAFFEELTKQAAERIEAKKSERDPIVDFVLSYINAHYGDELSLDLIADKLNMSAGYLRNYFKEKTGRNISDCVNEVRVMAAKKLLEGTDMKIHEVAANVGYPNANSFIRMFRSATHVTPGEYRRLRTTALQERESRQ
ncbi:helix-turn-helix domain-containing protein [Paenibacillus eucommiae]|uniref:AraC-like DNA-binding protein n=1 Tax=Paenibacillus eucommiae TaxID=1355755 RepID=A0ABS4IX09_9BACL|nr:AraC family transcriptional regulator [Paenibacillus eucommiae]MBP1991531.1 AraC-like DNA-binding protein [Paenibacillus eucommiae]